MQKPSIYTNEYYKPSLVDLLLGSAETNMGLAPS